MADIDQVKDKNHEGDNTTGHGAPKVLSVHKRKADKKEKGAGSMLKVRRKNDVGWQHGTAVATKPSKIQCNYCHMEYSCGVSRFKDHLAGTHDNIAPCRAVPNEVRQQMLDRVNKLRSNLIKKRTPSEDVQDNEANDRVKDTNHEGDTSHGTPKALRVQKRKTDKKEKGAGSMRQENEAYEKLMTCIPILERLEGIGGGPFTNALKLLKEDPLWRDVFLALSDDRKKDVVLHL